MYVLNSLVLLSTSFSLYQKMLPISTEMPFMIQQTSLALSSLVSVIAMLCKKTLTKHRLSLCLFVLLGTGVLTGQHFLDKIEDKPLTWTEFRAKCSTDQASLDNQVKCLELTGISVELTGIVSDIKLQEETRFVASMAREVKRKMEVICPNDLENRHVCQTWAFISPVIRNAAAPSLRADIQIKLRTAFMREELARVKFDVESWSKDGGQIALGHKTTMIGTFAQPMEELTFEFARRT